MSNKKLLIIICLIILSPVLIFIFLFSLRIWPMWLLLIIIAGVVLYFRRNNIPEAEGVPGRMQSELEGFFLWLNNLINSSSFKNFTKKLFFYPLLGIILIAVVALAVEFLGANYFKARSTKKEMIEITEAISKYKYHQNKYPQDLQQVIGNNPLKKDWLSDQWEKPYKYTVTADGQNFFLVSQDKEGRESNDISFDKNGEHK